MRSLERKHENYRIEQKFLEINKQIGELTSMVKPLTKNDKQLGRERQNVRNMGTSLHSDRYIFLFCSSF